MESSKQVVRCNRLAFSEKFTAEAVRMVKERAWVRAQREMHGTGTGPTGETPERSCGASDARWRRCAKSRPSQKNGGVLRESIALRCAVIAHHEDGYPVRLMRRVVAVSVSGYSAYRRRPER